MGGRNRRSRCGGRARPPQTRWCQRCAAAPLAEPAPQSRLRLWGPGTRTLMSHDETPETHGPAAVHGLLAEYDSPTAIISASKKIRDAGFSRWDTFTPFPVHGIDKAMGIKMTVLPWIVLGAGLTGLAT